MSKRYFVLGLSVVLALALAVPAFGGPSNPIASISASAKQTANKALKKAKAAQKTANSANSTANSASAAAKTAQDEAKKAQTTANGAQSSANGAQSSANGAKSIAEEAKVIAEIAAEEASANVQGIYFNFGTATAEDTEVLKNASAFCDGEDDATGGGYSIAGAGAKSITVTTETPTLYGDGWFVTGQAISGTPTWSIQANTVCAENS